MSTQMERCHINLDEEKMQKYFDSVMDRVYLLYHMHPTNLPHVELTPAEKAEMIEYDAMGRSLAKILDDTAGGRKLKKVILYGDPKRSNGLPRRGYSAAATYHRPDEGLVGNGVFILVMLAMAAVIGLVIYGMW